MKKINLDGVNEIFEQFYTEENKDFMNIMNGNSDTLSSCPFGIITCKFIEKDKLMIEELIPEIQSLLKNESFQNRIVQLEKDQAKVELKAIENKINTTNYNEKEKQNALRFYKPQIKRCIDKIENLDFEKFVLDCEELFNSISDIYQDDLEFYREYYIYCRVAKILFEEYKRNKAKKK
jgi:hypothetical protein